MAYLVNSNVLINDARELIGVNTAGINTALYVGGSIQLDAATGIVTATSFSGSGADLTNIDAQVIVSDGIPVGVGTDEGDLYYDSTDLKLFTYYDNNWVEASPVPPGATSLSVTNEAGITTATVDLLTETLVLSGTANEIEVGVDIATDTLTFGLTNEVSIGGSMTATEFFGDGSNLTGVGLATDSNVITTGNIQAGVITATTSLEATGTGTGLEVTNDATIGGNLDVTDVTLDHLRNSNSPTASFLNLSTGLGILVTGDLLQQSGEYVSAVIRPNADNSFDLGTVDNGYRSLYLETSLIGNDDTIITGISSVFAEKFYGDGSNLSNLPDADTVTSQDNQDAGDYPMPFLSAVGAGASIYTDSTANEEFTYSPSTGILKVKEFDALSDARLKTNIVEIENALGKIDSLRGVEYDWKNGSGSSVGIIAQEVQEVYPQLVSDSGERLTVNYNGLVGLLIAAVKEMSVELAELKAQK